MTSHLCRENGKNEWLLWSENWHDFVIHIPQFNVTPAENNYANLSIKKSKIHISSIVTKRDCTRKDQNGVILSIRPELTPFLLKHMVSKLGAISLTYFATTVVNNFIKTKINTYPYWSYIWWWWHGEQIHGHYHKS